MARKKKNEKELCSIDEEMLMWTSYRYCIGRHTYVSTLSNYIAKKYYDKLTDERLCFTASDIRSCINDQLSFGSFSLRYDGTVPYDERDGFNDLLMWVNDNINEEKDFCGIESVVCYKESYNRDAPKLYRVRNGKPNSTFGFSSLDISDLFYWYDLACLFDKKHYYKVHVKYDGKEEDVICFQTWKEKYEPCKDNPAYCQRVPFKYEKVYKSVDDFIGKGSYAGCLYDDYIVSVEEYDATQEKPE